jgi:hypothetical protein
MVSATRPRIALGPIYAEDQLKNLEHAIPFLHASHNAAFETEASQMKKRAESCDSTRPSFEGFQI